MAEVAIALKEISEFEMSPMEVDELRSVLEDVLLSSGKFNGKQIGEWLDGFDVCEEDEHRHNLIACAYEFIKSGEEQDVHSTEIVENKLFSDQEKAELIARFQQMDYVELSIFLELVEHKLQKAEKLEKDKKAIQKNNDLSAGQIITLVKEFESKKIDDREIMVGRLPMIVAEFRRKNEIDKNIIKIQNLINFEKIFEARAVLNSGVSVGSRYMELEMEISRLEMDEARNDYLLAT